MKNKIEARNLKRSVFFFNGERKIYAKFRAITISHSIIILSYMQVYTWWQSNNRDKYPSSLLVTVTSVPSSKQESVLYQQLPLNDLFDDSYDSQRRLLTERRTSESTIGLPKWARLAAQSCKIPNEKMFETEASENGCFYVAFSNDGKYLACVHSEEYNYPIVIYEVRSQCRRYWDKLVSHL